MKETKDDNLYSDFLQSIKERDAKVEASIIAALAFLYKSGYVTKEEYLNKESERLCDIKTYYSPQGGKFIIFVFDDREWVIAVEVDCMLNVIKVELEIGAEEQLLYERKWT